MQKMLKQRLKRYILSDKAKEVFEKRIFANYDCIISFTKSIEDVNECKKTYYTKTLPIHLEVLVFDLENSAKR